MLSPLILALKARIEKLRLLNSLFRPIFEARCYRVCQRVAGLGVGRSEGVVQAKLERCIWHDLQQGHTNPSVQADHALVLHDPLSCLDHVMVDLHPAPTLAQLPAPASTLILTTSDG